MYTKRLASLAIALILLVSMVGTAAAQTGDQPAPTLVTTETGEEENVNYSHPVVILLDGYFGEQLAQPEPTATPGSEPPVSESGLSPVGEQIAQYHADGMGFGVLVKLYAMVAESQEACAADAGKDPATCALKIEDLVTQFNSGVGVGALMKTYGRPSMLGVGHVKQLVDEKAKEEKEKKDKEEKIKEEKDKEDKEDKDKEEKDKKDKKEK